MNRAAALAATGLALVATPAVADPLTGLKDGDCAAQTAVDHTALRDAAIDVAGIRLSQYEAVLRPQGGKPALAKSLGDAARSGAAYGTEWSALWREAVALTGANYRGAKGHQARIDAARAPATNEERAYAFLNGDAPWLTVSCPPKSSGPILPKVIDAISEALIIAETLEDAGKAADGRKPATAAWTRNRDANTDSADIDMFVGFPGWEAGGEQRWRPFVALQKDNTSEKVVDDLTVGLLTNWAFRQWLLSPTITTAISHETDTEFESRVWRGDLAGHLNLDCGGRNNTTWGVMCMPRLVADYADIDDPGNKEKLAELSSYARVGAGLDLLGWVYLSDDLRLNANAGYTFRNDIDGSDTDAERVTFGLSLSPVAADWFSFGAEWVQGEDLTSLQPVDEISLKVGFKH